MLAGFGNEDAAGTSAPEIETQDVPTVEIPREPVVKRMLYIGATDVERVVFPRDLDFAPGSPVPFICLHLLLVVVRFESQLQLFAVYGVDLVRTGHRRNSGIRQAKAE